MTVDLNPARQCRTKSCYMTKREAKLAIRRTQTWYGRDVLGFDDLVAYRCPHCSYFHFGHQNQALKERLALEASRPIAENP